MFFVPLNDGVNRIARLSVSMLPLGAAVVLLPRAMKHWLLESVALLPTVARTHLVPRSSNRESAFAARS